MWSPETVEAFEISKHQLINAILLAFAQQEAPVAMFMGALNTAVGTALVQRVIPLN